MAIGSITTSLATRYSGFWGDSVHQFKTVQSTSHPDAKKQRLAKDAVVWVPPVFSFSALPTPSFRVTITSVKPSLSVLYLEESLFTRPPPSV